MSRTDIRPDPLSYPPRGMSREEAARYIGVGTTLFDEMVADGRMPKGKRINGRIVWDRYALDAAFSDLDSENVNTLDRILGQGGKVARAPGSKLS